MNEDERLTMTEVSELFETAAAVVWNLIKGGAA